VGGLAQNGCADKKENPVLRKPSRKGLGNAKFAVKRNVEKRKKKGNGVVELKEEQFHVTGTGPLRGW